MERAILHSDLNCFYASVEMMLDPRLRGKAVAVCGCTEDRHGIVLAKSEKAKRAGVKTGMVNWEAKQCCRDLIIVPPQYDQYLKYSKLTQAIYQRYTDMVEPFGMDECWLDVTGSRYVCGDARTIAENIRRSVKEELGLTVSIGVSFNKVFAKLGSDMKKPDAITEISPDSYKEKVWPLPCSDMIYCGPATTAKLARYGVRSIGDVAACDPVFLKGLLGVNGLGLWSYANGRDNSRVIDHTFYPVIYGAEESDDWTDPKVWKKANPSLGITVGIDKVKDACESAKQNPGEENSFRQLRLNQWVKQAVRWMPMDKWDKCEFAVSEDDLEGRVCYGGLDLSSTTDSTAFVLVFPPEDEDDKYIILPYFWIPEDNLDLRVRRDHVPYDVWERQGFLQTTEGNVVHYGYIEKFIESLGERFNIREIAFDRWGAVQMVQNLEGMGFTVVPFGQGFKDMSPPTKELMKLVLEQRIAHGGHPVLRWMMDNIFIRTDPAGNIKPDKEKSTEKIDGAVATIMALDRAIRCGNDKTESVYDSRGLLFI